MGTQELVATPTLVGDPGTDVPVGAGGAGVPNVMLLGLAIAATSILGVVSWWLRLRFLRHVYDRGGAEDLAVAGTALCGLHARLPCVAARIGGEPDGPGERPS